jgi:DNA repair exonuclease SbcCD ATPase subunit
LNRNAGDDPAALEFNKTLKSQYEYLNQSLNERITILNSFINELKLFNEDYNRLSNSLNRIDANLQIEHHGSTPFGSVHGKTLEAQLSNLKQVKVDLESLNSSIDALNSQSQKYLFAKNIDLKYSSKLKLDMNTLNDKISQLRIVYTRKLFQLEDALAKSTQVDNQIDDLENWISHKEREILDDEGIIITEDQFDQRTVKYKQLKSELERKEPQIKHIIDTGNDMLKNSSANSSNVTDLAHNMISINTKWTNLIKKVDFKNTFFSEMGELINELRS